MLKSRYKQPIIIKRVRIVASPHRIAQWKVAYADFVTALMAFFLLLWLINATTPIQKMQIAEYFTPTMGLDGSLGTGQQGGMRPGEAGDTTSHLVDPGLVLGQVRKGSADDIDNADLSEEDIDATKARIAPKLKDDFTPETEEFRNLMDGINQSLRDVRDKKIKRSLLVQDTPEGLKIDLIDEAKNPLFLDSGDELSPAGKKTLDIISKVIKETPNMVSIHAHMEHGHSTMREGYSIWELSTDRANAVRRYLIESNIEPERIAKVVGEADKAPLLPRSPNSPRNRRVTLLLVKDAYVKVLPKPAKAKTEAVLPGLTIQKPAALINGD